MLPEEVWKLVPKENPPGDLGWAMQLAQAGELSEEERRAYLWAVHLFEQVTGRVVSTAVLGLGNWGTAVPNIQDITAGFIAYDNETPNNRWRQVRLEGRLRDDRKYLHGSITYTFGIVIGVSPPTERLGDDLSQLVDLEGGFPVVAELRRDEPQAPPHPLNVTSTCFVTPRSSKRFCGSTWSQGILIARHTLARIGFRLGASVPMRTGVSYPVIDIDSSATTIDAAILDYGSHAMSKTPLPLATVIAPGMNVEAHTASGSFTAQVLRINDHPTYFGNMMAHRIIIDSVGIVGDSGSLVTTTGSNPDAVGLYMGSLGVSPAEGIAQSLRQVVSYFDVELHR